MNIYEYNSSSINEFTHEDAGLLISPVSEILDCGEIFSEPSEVDGYSEIIYTDTVTPFGGVNVSSGDTIAVKQTLENLLQQKVVEDSLIISKVVINWIGYNFIFETNSNLIRQVVPDESGGGI
jgi:hypothetical protein